MVWFNIFGKGAFMKFRRLRLQTLISACIFSLAGCSSLTLMPAEQMDRMGIDSFSQIKEKEKVNTDKATNAYVQCIADAITKHVPKESHRGDWEVVVFESDQINAFALPGGKIGVYTAILNVAKTPDQLAAIMGHEVAHVIAQHANKRVSSNMLTQAGLEIANQGLKQSNVANQEAIMMALGLGAQYGVLMPYGRSHESESDIIGQNLMAKAGFNPAASIDLWRNMAAASGGKQPAEFMSTHPSHSTRIKQLTENLVKTKPIYQANTNKPQCKKP